MSLTFDPSKAQTCGATTAATGVLPAFSFGAAGAGDANKGIAQGSTVGFGQPQDKSKGLFSGGLTGFPAPTSGFSFGTAPGTPASTVGGGLASAPTTGQTTGLTFGAATPSTGMTFGPGSTPALATAPSFGLSGATATTTATTGGLTFGAAKPANAVGFPLGGGGEAAAPAAATGLTFGTPSTIGTATGFGLSNAATATTVSTTTTTATGFGGNTTSTTAATGFALGTPATTAATPGFNFGMSTATPALSAAPAPGVLTAPSTQLTLGTTTTVSSSASSTQPVAINFFQLEESINKWTLELEEQEKVFVNQASQINAWDKLLITNGDKIVALNQEVERVKIEQQQLEHELDYVVGQQKELQDCLVPLEKELASLTVSDPEREYTYRLAEDLDKQLKGMLEDLKEIIEHLNEANRSQDSSDPIVQIGKILNAHMNSLQWLDQQTALLNQKIQQIEQMHQHFRQENERNFSLAYN